MLLNSLLKDLFRRREKTPAKQTSDTHSETEPKEYGQSGSHTKLEIRGVPLFYATPNLVTSERARTLLTKEPVTIEWLNQFKEGDVLIDVGANVGMYSIYAALVSGAKVFSFEPESQNYSILNQNIVLNNLGGRVTAYCMAISDECNYSLLYMNEFQAGGATHNFGEDADFDLTPRQSRFSQGSFSDTLDGLLDKGVIPAPDHIKIDVDGIEHKVIHGASKLLGKRIPQSVLIEINTNIPEHMDLVSEMRRYNYSFSEEQVDGSMRKEGQFKGLAEFLFWRN